MDSWKIKILPVLAFVLEASAFYVVSPPCNEKPLPISIPGPELYVTYGGTSYPIQEERCCDQVQYPYPVVQPYPIGPQCNTVSYPTTYAPQPPQIIIIDNGKKKNDLDLILLLLLLSNRNNNNCNNGCNGCSGCNNCYSYNDCYGYYGC